MTLFSQEEVTKAYGNEMKAEGREEQARKTALNLAKTGLTPEQIVSIIDFGVEKVEEWLDMQSA